MLHGFSYREKDPNYNKYEQQFNKESSQADKTKKQSKDVYINKIQRDATVCRCLFTAKLLYVFRFGCLSHPSSGIRQTVIAASGTGHITCQSNNLPPGWQRWRKVVALTRDMTCTRSCSYSLTYS
jgi:hypothetical protein